MSGEVSRRESSERLLVPKRSCKYQVKLIDADCTGQLQLQIQKHSNALSARNV